LPPSWTELPARLLSLVEDPAGWLLETLFPGPLGAPLGLLTPLLQLPLGASPALDGMWRSLALASSGLVGVAALARALRVVLAGEGGPASVLVEVAIRAGVTVGLVEVSREALVWAFGASTQLSGAILDELISRAGEKDLVTWLGVLLVPRLGSALKLALFVSAIYVVVMLVAARLLMLFSIVTAPLVIPIVAYSERSELLSWWGRLTLGALLAPLVSAVVVGVTALLASGGGQVIPVPGLGSAIAVVGGFMLLGNALRHLTVHSFQIGHGLSSASVAVAVLAARTAASVAVPGAANVVAASTAATTSVLSPWEAGSEPHSGGSLEQAEAYARRLSLPPSGRT
jgi:hypothetical protein